MKKLLLFLVAMCIMLSAMVAQVNPPFCANLNSPVNGATNIATNISLTWNSSSNATSYDVYFGTNPNPGFVVNTSQTTFSPTLNLNTTYYWKIVPRNSSGEAQYCEIRNFTTGKPPVSPSSWNINGDFICSTANFVLQNTSGDILTVSNVTSLSAPWSTNFDATSVNLSTGESYNFTITFAPTFSGGNFSGGNFSNQLVITTNLGNIIIPLSAHVGGKNINVQTLSATNVANTTATLNGTVEDHGLNPSQSGGYILNRNGIFDTIYTTLTYNYLGISYMSHTVSNLNKNTSYQYKAFAIICDQMILGNEVTFTTLPFNENDTVYLIENQTDLINLANLVNGGNSFSGQEFILTNDIILPNTPNNVLSIGDKNTNRPFSGEFDGNQKQIFNVFIDHPNTPYQGFFGYTKNATIKNLGLVNITASGREYTGGMVGYAENTRLDYSYVSGGTLFALSYCGGLVGYQTAGTNSIITGCYNTCTVTGNNYVGGLLGYSYEGTVRNSYAAALVSGLGKGVGAIIGGALDVLSYNCWFNSNTTGQTVAIGENKFKGEEGDKTSNEMRMQAFVTTLNQGLTVPAWKMDYNPPINNGFPILIWQTNVSASEIVTLSSLTVSEGALSPVFSSEVYSYKVNVANDVTSIIINATPTVSGATVSGAGVKQLAVGSNPFTIAVTAADGVTKKNYTVTVIRANAGGGGDDDDTGIADNEAAGKAITVYPNPTTGQLTINNEQLVAMH